MRFVSVSTLVSVCLLVPVVVPAQGAGASSGGFTISPYGMIAKPTSVETDMQFDTDFGSFDAEMTFESSAALGVGVAATKSFGDRWSLFGDLSRGGSDVDVKVCGDGGCDEIGIDMSLWSVTAGAERRLGFTPFQTGSLQLLLGATATHMEFDIPDQSEDISVLNPGVLVGLAMSVPITRMADIRFHVTDAVLKLDGSFDDDLEESFESPGIAATSDSKTSFVQLFTLGFGVRIRF